MMGCESAWRLTPQSASNGDPRRLVAKALCGNDDRTIRQGQHSTPKGVKIRGRFTPRVDFITIMVGFWVFGTHTGRMHRSLLDLPITVQSFDLFQSARSRVS
jgi:hypothetical protein